MHVVKNSAALHSSFSA